MKILIVEDERQLSEALIQLLRSSGYSADAVYDGQSGLDFAQTGLYDVVVLDIMLPQMDGLTVLKKLRQSGCSVPVLLLTAKSEASDKISGLDSGADDYLTKPFIAGELLARIRVLSRRRGEYIGDTLTFGSCTLDKNTHELSCGGKSIKLGLKEYETLEMLMANAGQIVPKERFIEKIWGYDSEAEYNSIEVYVSFLRKKLLALGADIRVKAVRSVGYKLEHAV